MFVILKVAVKVDYLSKGDCRMLSEEMLAADANLQLKALST